MENNGCEYNGILDSKKQFMNLQTYLLDNFTKISNILSPYFSKIPIFSKNDCEHIISIGYSKNFEDNKKYTPDTKIFNNKINFILPSQEVNYIYEKIYQSVVETNNEQFHFNLYGFGEPLKFIEYNETFRGFISLHSDLGYNGPSRFRKLTVIVQLSDENSYEGGDLVIQHENVKHKITRKQGSIIIFPSFLLHEVKEVTKGIRNSLVTFAYGPPFC